MKQELTVNLFQAFVSKSTTGFSGKLPTEAEPKQVAIIHIKSHIVQQIQLQRQYLRYWIEYTN